MEGTLWIRWIVAACFGLFMALPAVRAQGPTAGPDDRPHARARLISESVALSPGQINHLAVTFDIDEGWHLYWNGRNDTGFAPQITISCPEGFTIGQPQWPAPTRHVMPGGILDHIFEHRLTLIYPVTVPAEARHTARFRGSGEWLVCKTACIPGDGEFTLEVSVGGPDAGKAGPDAGLFAEARERHPRPLPKDDPPVSLTLGGDGVTIKSRTAKDLAFYPSDDCAKLKDAILDAATKKGSLTLRLDDWSMSARVKGILEVRPPNGAKPQLYLIDYPIASPGGAPASIAPPGR
jgi:DsbC/DsbD-like thiol-disulfide interchange protein